MISGVFAQTRSSARNLLRGLLKDHHHLIGMQNVEAAAQKLSRQVRIGMRRIEQRDPVAKFNPFSLKPPHFGPALFQQGLVLAQCEEAAGTDNRKTAHDKQACQSNPLGKAFARKDQTGT